MATRKLKLLGVALFSVFVALAIWSPDSISGSVSRSEFKKLLDAHARLATRETKTYRLPPTSAGKVCSLLVSTPSPF
jgi:hypothetical protein